jgi:putative redox protein
MQAIATIRTGFRTEITVGGHTLLADEPADQGGEDAGPTAMGLLAAALGACTAATLRSYANLKGLPLEGVEVDVEIHRRKPSELKEAGEGAKGTVATKKITIIGDKLTNEQRVRMLEIAEKCPVNRALHDGVDFT